MSDFTDADYERMAKWCERPDGTTPYNAICRLFDSLRPMRARVAELTADVESRAADCELNYNTILELRKIIAEQDAALAKREVVAAFPEWISVDDRLPEHGQNVAFVVRSNLGAYDDGRVLGGKYYKRDVEGFSEFSVPGQGYFARYWLPLPDAPGSVGYVSAQFASRLAREFNVVRNGASAVPEAVAKDGPYQRCLRDVVKQLVLMMEDCEEHADGRISIDCATGADQFLRRIYDLLNALEIYTPDCVDEAFAAILSAADTEVKK